MIDPSLGLVGVCVFLIAIHKLIWEPLVLQAHLAATSTTSTTTYLVACDCSAELRKVVELQEKQERLRLELQFWWGSALIAFVMIFILLGAFACISCCCLKSSPKPVASPPTGSVDLPDRLALTSGTTTVVTPAVRKAILAAAQKA